MPFTIKHNNELSMLTAYAMADLVMDHIKLMDPKAEPQRENLAQMIFMSAAGASRGSNAEMYAAVALTPEDKPVGVAMGYITHVPVDGQNIASLTILAMQQTQQGVSAGAELTAHFDDWAVQRFATVVRVEIPTGSLMPALPDGYMPSVTTHARRVEPKE